MSMSASESFTPRLFAETLAAPQEELRQASKRSFRNLTAGFEIAADFVAFAIGASIACVLGAPVHIGPQPLYSLRDIGALSVAGGLFAVLLLQRDGAYRGSKSVLKIRETERCIRASVQSLILLLLVGFLLRPGISSSTIFIALILVPVLLTIEKHLTLLFIRILLRQEPHVNRIAVYGVGETGRRVASTLLNFHRAGLDLVGMIDNHAGMREPLMFEMGYRRLVVASFFSPEQIAAASNAARHAGVRIAFLAGPEIQEHLWTDSIDLDGLGVTSIARSSGPWLYEKGKRLFDLLLSSLLLVVLAPLLFGIALLIKLDSPGPALFIQKRVGRNGELFNIYKFRSMHTYVSPYDLSPNTSLDPRITRIGRLLRRLSLDEFPQLINVFFGNMSLVGPRPEMPFIVEGYSSEHRKRLQVIPGITGLWQLSADRAFPIHKNIQYDLYYIRNRGLFLDFAILIHTLLFAMHGGI
jgi:exopolysaccharide biosynthesis polyprenyl glycosylphosphotransferase